jgi:hypothetical protein
MHPTRLRIAADPSRQGIVNAVPQAINGWWRGTALRVEFTVMHDGAVSDAGNLASVSCNVKATQTETALLMGKTIFAADIDTLVTLDGWRSGTAQHGVISFAAEETAVPLLGKARRSLWLALVATLTDDSVVTLAAGMVECLEPNVEADDPPPDYPAPIILPGPQGPEGNSKPIPLVAAVALSSNSFVHINAAGTAEKADAVEGKPAHGFTPAAVLQGNAFTAHRVGAYNGFSGITPGAPYWLGTNGLPPATVPASPSLVSQRLGTGSAADTISVDIEPEITL